MTTDNQTKPSSSDHKLICPRCHNTKSFFTAPNADVNTYVCCLRCGWGWQHPDYDNYLPPGTKCMY